MTYNFKFQISEKMSIGFGVTLSGRYVSSNRVLKVLLLISFTKYKYDVCLLSPNKLAHDIYMTTTLDIMLIISQFWLRQTKSSHHHPAADSEQNENCIFFFDVWATIK